MRTAGGRPASAGLLRPIRPEDERQHAEFLAAVSPEDLRLRFFRVVRSFEHSQLARLTQIDYDREMAIIATARSPGGCDETLGVVRIVADPDGAAAEFAILVRSDLQGAGFGAALMTKIIRLCCGRKFRRLVGDVLFNNVRMLALAHDLGFRTEVSAEPRVVRVSLALPDHGSEPELAASASPAEGEIDPQPA